MTLSVGFSQKTLHGTAHHTRSDEQVSTGHSVALGRLERTQCSALTNHRVLIPVGSQRGPLGPSCLSHHQDCWGPPYLLPECKATHPTVNSVQRLQWGCRRGPAQGAGESKVVTQGQCRKASLCESGWKVWAEASLTGGGVSRDGTGEGPPAA